MQVNGAISFSTGSSTKRTIARFDASRFYMNSSNYVNKFNIDERIREMIHCGLIFN